MEQVDFLSPLGFCVFCFLKIDRSICINNEIKQTRKKKKEKEGGWGVGRGGAGRGEVGVGGGGGAEGMHAN